MFQNDVLHKMALNGKVLKQCEIFGRWSHECGGKHHRQVGGGHLVLSTLLVNSVEREAENEIMQCNKRIRDTMITVDRENFARKNIRLLIFFWRCFIFIALACRKCSFVLIIQS